MSPAFTLADQIGSDGDQQGDLGVTHRGTQRHHDRAVFLADLVGDCAHRTGFHAFEPARHQFDPADFTHSLIGRRRAPVGQLLFQRTDFFLQFLFMRQQPLQSLQRGAVAGA